MTDKELINTECESASRKTPSWFKLFPKELIDATGIRELEHFDDEEKKDLIYAIARATIDALLYFDSKCKDQSYHMHDGSRLYRTLFGLYKQNIDQAFIDLEERIRNGKKGGRPKKETYWEELDRIAKESTDE